MRWKWSRIVFEDPVCAVRTFADYQPFQGEASLYVICPEYHDDILAKHQPPSAAFFNGKRIADLVDPVPVVIRRAPAHIIFGSHGGDPVFPNVTALVRRHKRMIFETDELIWLPESVRSTVWGKGLCVEEAMDGKMRIADLVVDHS